MNGAGPDHLCSSGKYGGLTPGDMRILVRNCAKHGGMFGNRLRKAHWALRASTYYVLDPMHLLKQRKSGSYFFSYAASVGTIGMPTDFHSCQYKY